ncbi:MAG: DUF3052 family protein [Planctomycetes bacterium]|nr:DUF3052 family protein [Planctomycetota bacterium]
MGLEKDTTVFVDGRSHVCNVHLEPAAIVCRGDLKRQFALTALRDLAVAGARLSFAIGKERVEIELGKAAATWLDRIRNPRSRVQKLGVAAGMKVCVLGKADAEAIAEVAAVLNESPKMRLAVGTDIVLLFCAEPEDLTRLGAVEPKLADKGAVWVLWPKGRKDFAHEHVVAAGKSAGLSITKSMGFSEVLTGLRLVRSRK